MAETDCVIEGCNSKNCKHLSPDFGYICVSCLQDLVQYCELNYTTGNLSSFIQEFMNIPKTTVVNHRIRKHGIIKDVLKEFPHTNGKEKREKKPNNDI